MRVKRWSILRVVLPALLVRRQDGFRAARQQVEICHKRCEWRQGKQEAHKATSSIAVYEFLEIVGECHPDDSLD
jgi:hypothetical protein